MKQLSILEAARLARRDGGGGYLAQLQDILRMKLGNPTLGASDYYTYRMYRRDFVHPERFRDFLGWRAMEALAESLNARAFVLPAWDKLAMWLMASTTNLPVPRLHAVYRPGVPMNVPNAMHNEEELRDFLSALGNTQLFAKPAYSQQGYGAMVISGFDAEKGHLVTSEGPLEVEQFVQLVTQPDRHGYYRPQLGYLFQEVLRAHPALEDLLGTRAIAGVRLACIQMDGEVSIIGVVWKLATGDNVVDNMRGGALGNLFSDVDPDTGSVRQILNGFWPRAKLISHHPRTGVPLQGFQLPCWPETIDLVKRASRGFPMLYLQHWDVAITDRGPVLLELNDKGAIDWLQVAGKGLLHGPLRTVLVARGNRKVAPWIDRIAAQGAR